jgi:hypothetical protein
VDRLARLGPLLAMLFVLVLQIHRLDDPDTWWHLASGRLIAETGTIARGDPFSYTAPGAPWTNRQWLFDLGIYELWRAAGPAGPILGVATLFVIGFGCLLKVAQRRMPGWAAAAVTALAVVVAAERFTVRPEAVTLCLLGLYVLLLDRPFTWGRALLVIALQAIWANAHALSILGVVPIVATLAAALAVRWLPLPDDWRRANDRGWKEIRPLAGALIGALAAEAATPWGLRGALFPLVLLRDIGGEEVLSYTVVEHRATSLAELTPTVALALRLLVWTGVVAALVSIRRLRFAPLALALAFGWAAMLARRNIALLGFGIVPLVAYGLGPLALQAEAWLGRRSRWLGPIPGVLVSLVLALQVGRVVHGDWYRDGSLTRAFGLGSSLLLYPQGAAEFLERQAPETRVLNDDLQGGLLIWTGYPRRKVFIDGRFQVYPRDVYLQWQQVLDDPSSFQAVARQWDVGAVVMHHPSPGRLEVAAAVSRLPGWRIAYLDGGGVVLLADGKPPGVPEGMTGPAPAASTPGVSGIVERLVAPLRDGFEDATTLYQRGRAIHYLFGPARYAEARADFEAALRLVPDYEAARIGVRATSATAGVQR